MDGLVIARRAMASGGCRQARCFWCIAPRAEAQTHLRRRGNPLKDTAGIGGQHAATVGLGHDYEGRAGIAVQESTTSITGGKV